MTQLNMPDRGLEQDIEAVLAFVEAHEDVLRNPGLRRGGRAPAAALRADQIRRHLPDLTEEDVSDDKIERLCILRAVYVSARFFGAEWVRASFAHNFGDVHPPRESDKRRAVWRSRVLGLGWTLLRLQEVPNFWTKIKELRRGDLQGATVELRVAHMVLFGGNVVAFHPRSAEPTYDLDAAVDAERFAVEVKARDALSVDLPFVRRVLNEAIVQLKSSPARRVAWLNIPLETAGGQKGIDEIVTFIHSARQSHKWLTVVLDFDDHYEEGDAWHHKMERLVFHAGDNPAARLGTARPLFRTMGDEEVLDPPFLSDLSGIP